MAAVSEKELVEYQGADGQIPFRDWLEALKDLKARVKIDARLLRLRLGNFGDAKSIGEGVHELRVDSVPGYRIYFAPDGQRIVVLLAGGTKGTQRADIKKAITYWTNYREEKAT